MIKVIIFDFDGVLINSHDIFVSFIRKYHPQSTKEEIEEIFNQNAHSHPIVKKIVEQHVEEIDKHYIENTTKNHFYIGAEDLIETLEKKYQLFINTSAPSYNVKHFLSLIGKDKSFKEILGCFEEKSKVKKFQIILEKYNLKKEECLFITDTLGDLKESEEIGIKSIALTWGVHSREKLKQGKSIAIVDNFEELKNKIKEFT